jgi:predicted metal-dependent TIM-barrel fold hydrolase
MYVIQPHYHAIARTTEDYQRMAQAGVVAVCEPSFWAGFERQFAGTFVDYFRQIAEFEPTRAACYGIKHYCWIAMNPKEAENVPLSREVLAHIPEFLRRPNVIGIGEIGFNMNSANEREIFLAQLELARQHQSLVLIHTPHLAQKYKGTVLTLALLKEVGLPPERVWIDHAEEHTIGMILDAGYWAGLTLYPMTKMSTKRAVDILERHNAQRIMVNSSADWGPSSPFTLFDCIEEFKARGHTEQESLEIFHNNPARFLRQSGKFPIAPLQLVTQPD